MNIKDIVYRVNFFRDKKKYSARELSMMIDKNESYISKLETLRYNIPILTLLDIIEALEITPEEFFAENYRDYKQDDELYNKIKNLPEDKKKALFTIINAC